MEYLEGMAESIKGTQSKAWLQTLLMAYAMTVLVVVMILLCYVHFSPTSTLFTGEFFLVLSTVCFVCTTLFVFFAAMFVETNARAKRKFWLAVQSAFDQSCVDKILDAGWDDLTKEGHKFNQVTQDVPNIDDENYHALSFVYNEKRERAKERVESVEARYWVLYRTFHALGFDVKVGHTGHGSSMQSI